MPYDEEKQRRSILRRGAFNYHRPMANNHKQNIRQLRAELLCPFKVGDFVEPRSATGGKVNVVCVGVILKHAIFEHKRTSIIYNPPKANKYYIRWTYDNGWQVVNWVQQRLTHKITRVKYNKFFKKHKIKHKEK